MTKQLRMNLLGAVGIGLMVTPVFAEQQNCARRDFVVERLADRYGETRQAMGLSSGNAVMEVFASEDTGSWTITVTYPTGLTCLVASGQSFEQIREALPAGYSDV